MYFLQPNQQRLLNSLNPLILVGSVFAIILFRSTSEPLLPNAFRQWDALLPFVVYFGQRRPFLEGAILTVFTSHLYSLCSSAPIGLFAVHYLIVFMIARSISYVIFADRWFSILGLIFFIALIGRFSLALIANVFGHSWNFFAHPVQLFGALLLNSLIGYLVYLFVAILDRLTYKVPQMNIELGEREI